MRMLADTIIVVLLCIIPAQHQDKNRFKDAFEKADRQFDIELSELAKASEEPAKSAALKTKREREEAMRDFCDFKALLRKMSYEGGR